ncbi:transcriptional regulator, BadM/Rrf2 family [Desulfofarcimen acetoxidans DSM 771]|jgi:Rrf2 family protein|uniref:Transcriptional regulator, BadM/Rrf2 family n=1 Tax=Desulfofarcimen acetoxidans (strain ATCC 49208 / DSM 771 / KCTC 5769 / VKM B-1644 / 5575) TaxID=485916 RepID=C8VWB3_DESAS|nr:Rrf2 family transcriptional regulator [Desulfofarcimen acetoxidans]ACV62465.1 transcriptional regulator, BadM/Rrf2 family [Desulfofarcimen acetoxidans DSM 771]
MQITRQTEYAIHAVIELAQIPFGDFVLIRQIANKLNIPEMFLKKTVQALNKSGIVVTQRGTNGGVRLSRPSDKLTVADVMAAIEGPLMLNVCLGENYQCSNKPFCSIHKILQRTQKAVLRELSRETFADIIKNKLRLEKRVEEV